MFFLLRSTRFMMYDNNIFVKTAYLNARYKNMVTIDNTTKSNV